MLSRTLPCHEHWTPGWSFIWPPVFFHHLNQSGPLTNRFIKKIRWDIQIFMNLPGVLYCAESISPGYDTPGSHGTKFFIKSPLGIMLRWVHLPRVCDPGKSLMTLRNQQPFLRTFAQAFKGTVAHNKCGFLFFYYRATFCIYAKRFLKEIFFTGRQFFRYENSTISVKT